MRPEAYDCIVVGGGPAELTAGIHLNTEKLRLLLTSEKELPPEWERRLAARGIGGVTGEIQELVGSKGILRELRLSDGTALKADAFFVSSPARGRTDLARQLGVEMAPSGHHAQPKSQRGDTNVAGVWIAGDLRPMTQQVSVATGTGNIAAVMIDQYLRKRDIGPV